MGDRPFRFVPNTIGPAKVFGYRDQVFYEVDRGRTTHHDQHPECIEVCLEKHRLLFQNSKGAGV